MSETGWRLYFPLQGWDDEPPLPLNRLPTGVGSGVEVDGWQSLRVHSNVPYEILLAARAEETWL